MRSYLLPFLLLLPLACDAGADAPPVQPTAVEAPTGPVARIVFIGQRESCDCTRKRIAGSWAALSEALAGRDLPVERLYADLKEEREEVDMYHAMEPMIVAPGIYFLDAQNQLVEAFQGEVSAQEFRAVLPEIDPAQPERNTP